MGDVHVHAAVQAGGLQRHIGEGLLLAHQIGEGGGLEAEFTFGHQLQAMFGCGIAQVIGQQRVDHHALQGNAMPQQDQAVVFGVLQSLGVVAAGQPGGEGGEHGFQGQLLRAAVFTAFVPQRDVGECVQGLSPADADAHQFGAERVEVGGLGVEGHRQAAVGAGHQPLHQGIQGRFGLDQLRFQGRQPHVVVGCRLGCGLCCCRFCGG